MTDWIADFETAAEQRATEQTPPWQPIELHPALVRSIQRFQTGENGDGANLIRKSRNDPAYLRSVQLFIAEEQNHARLLAGVLKCARAGTIDGHWTDTIFVKIRRAIGLRTELMTLMVAEVVALRYYRALRDGGPDPLVRSVAGRILADEERHVPFHTDRLWRGFRDSGRMARAVARIAWWVLMAGAVCVVAMDHRAALAQVGVPAWRFAIDTARTFRRVLASVFAPSRAVNPVALTAVRGYRSAVGRNS